VVESYFTISISLDCDVIVIVIVIVVNESNGESHPGARVRAPHREPEGERHVELDAEVGAAYQGVDFCLGRGQEESGSDAGETVKLIYTVVKKSETK
jgi:hypothetical protein